MADMGLPWEQRAMFVFNVMRNGISPFGSRFIKDTRTVLNRRLPLESEGVKVCVPQIFKKP